MEKTVNIEAKTSLQLPSKIRKIDFKCLKGYKLAKKDMDKANQNDQDKDKNKSTQNSTPTNNANQSLA